jgi:hypothetical protein
VTAAPWGRSHRAIVTALAPLLAKRESSIRLPQAFHQSGRRDLNPRPLDPQSESGRRRTSVEVARQASDLRILLPGIGRRRPGSAGVGSPFGSLAEDLAFGRRRGVPLTAVAASSLQRQYAMLTQADVECVSRVIRLSNGGSISAGSAEPWRGDTQPGRRW